MTRRITVGARLLGAFLATALISVAASAVGLLSFQAVERSQRAIMDEALPAQALAHALAEGAQALVALAPQLVMAHTDVERRSASDRIRTQAQGLEDLLARLRPRVPSSPLLEDVARRRADLVATLSVLDQQIAERIVLERSLRERLDESRRALEVARLEVERPFPGLSAEARIAARLGLSEIRAFLEQIPTVPLGRLPDLRTAHGAALARVNAALAGSGAALSDYLAVLPPDVAGADPYALRERQDAVRRRTDALLTAYTRYAFRLVFAASALVHDSETAILEAARKQQHTLVRMGGLLLGLAVLSLVTAGLLGFYAHRTVIRRLGALRHSMAAHVTGHAVPVPSTGNDEISDMAAALKDLLATIAAREGDLRASEAHLRAVIDAVPEGILSVDASGTVIAASRSAQDLFGQTASLVGTSLGRLVAPPGNPGIPGTGNESVLAMMERAAHTHQVMGVYCWRARTMFPADMSAHVLDHAGRRVTVVTLSDTSERHRAEAERAHFLALLAAAQEASVDGLMVTDREGTIITSNRRFHELLGLDPDRMVTYAQPRRAQMSGETMADPQSFLNLYQGVLASPEAVAADTLVLADGRLLEGYTAPFRVGGAIAGRLWSLRDITERERVRADLTRAKDAAEKALADLRDAQGHLVEAEKMASLGQLVAGVAHEINTPVGIAVTAASLIADETRALRQQVENDTLRRSSFLAFLEQIEEASTLLLANTERASELIQSFKQVAVDQTSDERRRFDLAHYTHEVLLSLGPPLRKAPHRLDVEIPEGLILDSYPGAFARIIANLVMNALIHAFPDPATPGVLRLSAQVGADDQIEMTVADSGVGMSAEVRRRLFDPFFTTRRGQGGSGLGLNIVYNLVTHTLGGRIEVDTFPGGGSRFLVTVPRIAPLSRLAAPEGTSDDPTPSRARGPRDPGLALLGPTS
ncbi:ATP-binding protein [Pararhodospirillum photometricum]|uniref:histidine kinase n=1 Tax=Pararhodospirillum photometricum DSM 122 TaxID=1150469 RepID=H6SRI2_PARPM|nr:ATP-binding protein [Pararhodospirillum photometricum]CCG07511.1 Sensor protein [Pararhodospirillum photometricum DSM 122]